MVTESRKYHPTKFTRLVVYPLSFIFFSLILAIIILLANGYRVDFKNNKFSISKTGMIIVSSRPSDAEILIDNKSTNKKTGIVFLPIKLPNIFPGTHNVQVKKAGYRVWSKNIQVLPNLVSWLNYVILFPEKLDIKEDAELANKNSIATSLNKRYIFLSQKIDNINNYYIYDFNNSSISNIWPKSYSPNEESLKNPEITEAVFNGNNDKLFIKVNNNGNLSNAILETNSDGRISAIDSYLNGPIAKLVWNPTDSNEFFALINGNIYRFNTNNLTNNITPVISNVVDFTVERNRSVYYISSEGENYSLVEAGLDGQKKNVVDQAISKDSKYKIQYSSNSDTLAVLPLNNKNLIAYYKLENKINSIELARNVNDFGFSPNGKKIFYQNGNIRIFDFSKEEEIEFNEKDLVKVDWYFDNNHLIVQTKNNLFVSDYDGTNKVILSENPVENYYLDSHFADTMIKENINSNYRYLKYNSEL